MQDIYDKLTEILQDVFDDDEIVASPELAAADVDGWDSLAHVRFILAIERGFGVKFSAAEASAFANVGELANGIAAKRSA
ncbi:MULTISPECIES: acyl carrier protein [Sphingomonas]|uniref:Acyl carrier protein n=1 Tax=Sphingomonas trueperi TaxID=53317 RepID=A0A7X5XYD1_9SPHN|nr:MULTISPECIES: acyl carrier protein [Sphingomonas]NJB97629.1 acyl carrier protein [Sphingomonas trueperi]